MKHNNMYRVNCCTQVFYYLRVSPQNYLTCENATESLKSAPNFYFPTVSMRTIYMCTVTYTCICIRIKLGKNLLNGLIHIPDVQREYLNENVCLR